MLWAVGVRQKFTAQTAPVAIGRASLMAKAWETLVNAAEYGEWNTFTWRVDTAGGKLREGKPAELSVLLRFPVVGMANATLGFEVLEVLRPTELGAKDLAQHAQDPSSPYAGASRVARICWGYQMVPAPLQPLILATRRCMELAEKKNNNKKKKNKNKSTAGALPPSAEDVVTLRHWDTNSGPLAPLVGLLFKDAIEDGFRRMTDDMRRHLEPFGMPAG